MPAKSESQGVDLDQLSQAGRKAAVDAEAKLQTARAALELRDSYVVRLYDAGARLTDVASIMLISKSRVLQIVARGG